MKERLYFIDIVRAFAILMMLQGHFIDTLLESSYRNLNSETYRLWSFFRGITAPTFFTISGLIFTYLLLRAKEKGLENFRMKKGISRGISLIAIGYFIRINFLNLLSGKLNPSFFATDVLHCIGLSLLLTIGIFFLCRKNVFVFSILTLAIGSLIFVLEPLYRMLQIEGIPTFIHNYISRAHGSVFRIIPWYGYSAMGSFLATIFYWNLHKKYFKTSIVSLFVLFGLFLIQYSSEALLQLFEITDINVFKDAANYNYLFTKLGYVLLYFALFYSLESNLKHPVLLKIGKKTLSIYILHFVLLYGSFVGIGLNRIIGKTLTPWQAIFGAIFFITIVCFISFHYAKTNAFLYKHLRSIFKK